LKIAVERQGDTVLWFNNLAGTLIYSGKASKAVSYAQKAIQLSEDFAAAHETLAKAKAATGELEGALKEIERAAGKFPGDEKIASARSEILEDYLSCKSSDLGG
jgi:Flp pilus assembly protein TadD